MEDLLIITTNSKGVVLFEYQDKQKHYPANNIRYEHKYRVDKYKLS